MLKENKKTKISLNQENKKQQTSKLSDEIEVDEKSQRVSLKNGLDKQIEMLDFSNVELKEDYSDRPIFISPDGVIFLETFSPIYRMAYQFLLSIGEPIQRPLTMHKFIMTRYSLYTAMVLQYEPKDIITCLERLSKNKEIPKEVHDYIILNTQHYGSARLFLDDLNYFLDIDQQVWGNVLTQFPHLKGLVSTTEFNFDSIINQNAELNRIQKNLQKFFLRKKHENEELTQKDSQNDIEAIQNNIGMIEGLNYEEPSSDDDEEEDQFVTDFILNNKTKRSFKRLQIIGDHFEVTKAIINCSVPLIQEYDFERSWQESQKLAIDLKPKIKIRYYQEKALKNIFIQKKARSGLIILPCGAGKTIVGVIAVERIKQSTVIICDSDVSVDQWRDELERWTTISKNKIVRFTGRLVDEWPSRETQEPIIVITTYYMLVKKRDNPQNVPKTKKRLYIDSMRERKWGVCIIDEVHKLPANTFQNVLKQYKFHFKLGLTATPYREDEKINNLFYMIGPKLYEENWYDLVNQGFLAKPYCVEIRCEMTALWDSEYNKKQKGKHCYKGHERELIHTSNPNKFRTLEYLIKVHEERGDKILVFCDRPMIINYYGKILKYPVIYGDVSQDERKTIFNLFKVSNQINTIFLSRVGDTAIDLPQANVGIQIGMHFKSRRQEVQRLGRIMRAKETYDGQYNAFWYTLISKNTDESQYCLARQKCLINQGFKYEIIEEKDMPYLQNPQKFKWMTKINESDYLYTILMSMDGNTQKKEEDSDASSQSSDSTENSQDSEDNFNIITKAVNPFSDIAIYKETNTKNMY